jgi:AcrR family transcriptional regulator
MTSINKTIQEERMKGYFIEATKKILKGEGLKSLNVRNIAKEAGYSYATLYNYFKDVKDLVFECVKDFREECFQVVESETGKINRGFPRIKAVVFSYMKFFVQYPGIFELFFLERINDLGYRQSTLSLIYNLLDDLTENEWKYCIENKICTEKQAELKTEALKNISLGILIFYLNRYNPDKYDEFELIANRQIDMVLGNKK